jgi:hypothetical protein
MKENRNEYQLLVWKHEEVRAFWRHVKKWEFNIVMAFTEIQWVGIDSIHMPPNWNQWWALVNTSSITDKTFLTWAIISICRKTAPWSWGTNTYVDKRQLALWDGLSKQASSSVGVAVDGRRSHIAACSDGCRSLPAAFGGWVTTLCTIHTLQLEFTLFNYCQQSYIYVP